MTELVTQPTIAPTRKMKATAVGSIIAIAILSIIDVYAPGLGAVLSEPVYAAVAVASGLISGWFTKEAKITA
jgi:hypothetical protein